MVFQDYALFPHMSVFDNVAFGIRMRGKLEDRRHLPERVEEMLEMVRLGGFGRRMPSELSGGQQQRVAIARALAPKPTLLLMDEPLSNLDAKVREEMRSELKDIQRKAAVTTVYVTHDQEEALALSDEVVVMSEGRIAQVAAPENVYSLPTDRFVATFVGRANILDGILTDDGTRFCVSGGPSLMLARPTIGIASVAIRPEHVEMSRAPTGSPNCVAAIVEREIFSGATTYVFCNIGGIRVTALILNRIGAERYAPGDKVFLTIPRAAVRPLHDAASEDLREPK
jgi:ABC-type Fe3+/spermidine/putrescine transport system ATPase subunit